ncbi:hypothetical protein Tco_0164404 [Tanacetum coccineum]
MATMAENVIAAGKENGDMLIESINKGPSKLAAKIVMKDTDKVTDIIREHTPDDLSPKERLRYDSDIKAANILLLGLSVYIYTLINHYQTAKEIWNRVKEMMEGIEMTNKNVIYAFLKNNEKDAKEVQETRQRFLDPLALLANTYNTPPSNSITQQLIQSPPKQSYAPPVVPQQPLILPIQPDFGFVVPTSLPTDDPIASLNKAMIFLSSAYSLRFLLGIKELLQNNAAKELSTVS